MGENVERPTGKPAKQAKFALTGRTRKDQQTTSGCFFSCYDLENSVHILYNSYCVHLDDHSLQLFSSSSVGIRCHPQVFFYYTSDDAPEGSGFATKWERNRERGMKKWCFLHNDYFFLM